MDKNNAKQPGILELVGRGDADAAATALQLVERTSLKPGQITSIFRAAATGMVKVEPGTTQADTFRSLMRISAWKMPAEAVRHFKWELITALNSPGRTRVDKLEALAIGTVVLMEERLLRKDHLLDVAETLADGFRNTTDLARIRIMEEHVAACLDKRLPHHHQRIYEAVFMLARGPFSVADFVLTAYVNRAESGALVLEPVVIERMKQMLCPRGQAKQGPLSDGDAGLPNPMAVRKHAAHAPETGRRTAANRLTVQ